MDLLIVNPGATQKRVYQDLSKEITAIEPPFWAALTAGFIRKHGYFVNILDANALNLGIEETAKRIFQLNPCLINIIVYGQQPAASTQLMDSVTLLCKAIKEKDCNQKIILTGLHPSALPIKTMLETKCDYVGIGEGFYTLLDLLSYAIVGHGKIRGLVYRREIDGVENSIFSNGRTKNVEDLTAELPDVAWDLLHMNKYRAHNHQCLGDFSIRNRYASISTSLGCPFHCKFCSIHATFGEHRIRYWSPEWVLKQIDYLVSSFNVKVLKIIDEMFIYNPKHFLPICNGLIKRDYDLNIWAYTRIDTIKKQYLKKLRKAGFRWLCPGIESGNLAVQDSVSKRIPIENIKKAIQMMHEADIHILGNYMFGLPGDNKESMQQTLDLAMELNCEFANFYCNMPYPGSELYNETKPEDLPDTWAGYSQHSYECKPLPTKYLTAKEILKFRDDAFQKYFTSKKYLDVIEQKFGKEALEHIKNMTKIRLKRKIFGDLIKYANCPYCGKFMRKSDIYDMGNNLHKLWICDFCNEDIPRGEDLNERQPA